MTSVARLSDMKISAFLDAKTRRDSASLIIMHLFASWARFNMLV